MSVALSNSFVANCPGYCILFVVIKHKFISNAKAKLPKMLVFTFYPVCRTSLSPAIQHECPGDIMAVVLQETRDQQEAYDYVHSNLGNQDLIMGEVFQPKVKSGTRI